MLLSELALLSFLCLHNNAEKYNRLSNPSYSDVGGKRMQKLILSGCSDKQKNVVFRFIWQLLIVCVEDGT